MTQPGEGKEGVGCRVSVFRREHGIVCVEHGPVCRGIYVYEWVYKHDHVSTYSYTYSYTQIDPRGA